MIRTLAFIICLLPTLVFAQREVLDKVIAQIGGESLLQSEVEDAYTMEAGRNPKVPTDLRCQIVENLLLQKLKDYLTLTFQERPSSSGLILIHQLIPRPE